MNRDNEGRIASAIQAAEELPEPQPAAAPEEKPRLLVEDCNPDRTVTRLRDVLASSGTLFDRGVPVRLAYDQIHKGKIAQVMTPDAMVMTAHAACRPYVLKSGKGGELYEADARLPKSIAAMYLEWRGEWGLPVLNGITTAPLLRDDGSIVTVEGYDPSSGMWCERLPDLSGLVPGLPTRGDAASALRVIRESFKTFCFADAEVINDDALGVPVVDIGKRLGRDESASIAALLTAVCRPSLDLAPGTLVRAASISGSGSGKGLLARCISLIAFGNEPHAVTSGATAEELEKRIAAELIGGSPTLFLDNLNNTNFKSNLLASAITERPARVRNLGRLKMVPLNSSAFVVLTGNGLTLSEDLIRRFITVEFDARTEDPEARRFSEDILVRLKQQRREILVAVLTIWRWGRMSTDIKPGVPLGSFGRWGQWVRDPLLALGCHDPVRRISESKGHDPNRQQIAELFILWWDRHQDRPVLLSQIDPEVLQAVDPQGRGRQYVSSRLMEMTGTRIAGYMLTRQEGSGRWGKATYALAKMSIEA